MASEQLIEGTLNNATERAPWIQRWLEQDVPAADYACEQCGSTKDGTRYDTDVSPLRLCVSCFEKLPQFKTLRDWAEYNNDTEFMDIIDDAARAITETKPALVGSAEDMLAWLNEQVEARPDNIVEIVMDVMYAIAPDHTVDIRKRAIKATHFLSRGFELSCLHDLMFYGELLPEESSKHLDSNYRVVYKDSPMTIAQIENRYPLREQAMEAAA